MIKLLCCFQKQYRRTKRRQEIVDFDRTPTQWVLCLCENYWECPVSCTCVCLDAAVYHPAQAMCGLCDFWLGLWANERSCFELTVISWLQLRLSSCCWISWSRLSSPLHSFISCRTFSPGCRSPSELKPASGPQSWCATDTTWFSQKSNQLVTDGRADTQTHLHMDENHITAHQNIFPSSTLQSVCFF